jgi:transglutaminase-like putative cysteine protease
MTRECRDTLFLLAVLGWTLAPQLLRVPPWCAAVALAALAWRASLAWRGTALPSRWVLLPLLALALGLTVWQYRSLVGKEAGVTLLVALTALKTLELRARRDAVVVFFLGFLGVLANFLYSQSLALALGMLVAVWGLLTALALAHRPATTAQGGGTPPLRQAALQVLRSAGTGAPLVLLLFLFFPRLPPLWGMPADAGGRTGLSDTLELGQVAELAADDTIAMRVRFIRPMPATERLYFRGPVLRLYDGRRWSADDGGIGARPPPPGQREPVTPAIALQLDQPVAYELTVEPLQVATLPLLEITAQPPQVDGDLPLALRDDLHWQPHRPLTDRWRLRAVAYLQATYAPNQWHLVHAGDTALPPGRHPRTRAWAETLKAQPALRGAGPAQLAAAVLAHIRTQGYSYTLAPDQAPGDRTDPLDTIDPIDHFWLDAKAGFCEHYASAFVVVMRALGVPARIVTGYQGGFVNPVDGVLEVRQSDAHAWAEYFTAADGWVRADPTAAVAPERISFARRLAPPRGMVAGALAQLSPDALAQLRNAWRALDNRWTQWVLNYARHQQFDLLRGLGWDAPDLLALARALFIGVASLGLAGALWAAWDGRRRSVGDAWLRRYARIQQALQRRGLAVPGHLPPRALAQAALGHWGDSAQALAELLLAMDAQRYRPAPNASLPSRAALRHALRGLTPTGSMSEPVRA